MSKKFYQVFVRILFAVLITALLICSGCVEPDRRETAEDCIPSEMGSPEGLWLYKGNLRMRTDGSGSEDLITSVVSPSGNEYGKNDWKIKSCNYITEAQKILFVITAPDEIFLYGYNYKNKQGNALYDLPSTKINMSYANNRIYVKCDTLGLLYDFDFNLLSDEIDGGYAEGIVYKHSHGKDCNYFKWWSNGIHNIILPMNAYSPEVKIYGDYIYLCYADDSMIAVNMHTEEFTKFDVFGTSFDPKQYSSARRIFESFYFNGTDLYVFSVIYKHLLKDPDETDWFYELHKITNNRAELIYDFGSARWGALMQVYENNLYFQVKRGGRESNIYYYCHNTKTGKTSEISKSDYHTTPTTTAATKVNNAKIVGEYEFNTTSVGWGYSGFMSAPAGYCYYLIRKHGNKEEVMQYSFDHAYFYDDICEF